MSFNKPPLSIAQQVDLLQRRGMIIRDRQRVERHLTHINYYRLRAYWLPFEVASDNGDDHAFRPGTDFDAVLSCYVFDRKLRLLLLDAIERVEVSFRTVFSQYLSNSYGPFVLMDGSHFSDARAWRQSLDELCKEYQRSSETFAKHYRKQYPELDVPPVWVSSELMTLGHLSRWIKNLARPADRQAIARVYELDEQVLVNFAHHLTIVRNHCAHHGRVWNRRFAVRMRVPRKPRRIAGDFNPDAQQQLYNTMTMLVHLLDLQNPGHDWRCTFDRLIAAHPDVPLDRAGFPAGWRQAALWNRRSCDVTQKAAATHRVQRN